MRSVCSTTSKSRSCTINEGRMRLKTCAILRAKIDGRVASFISKTGSNAPSDGSRSHQMAAIFSPPRRACSATCNTSRANTPGRGSNTTTFAQRDNKRTNDALSSGCGIESANNGTRPDKPNSSSKCRMAMTHEPMAIIPHGSISPGDGMALN